MDVATRACSACGGVAGGATVGVASTGGVEAAVPAVGPAEHVGRLDPVG
jgi:hypothetical protein